MATKGRKGPSSRLASYLREIPAVEVLSEGREGERWWLKLRIDIEHRLAWRVVQELGFVLNYLSVEERLPTRFFPVSAPPYMNGGPRSFLSWVIENTDAAFTSDQTRDWLESRLPAPVANEQEWELDDA